MVREIAESRADEPPEDGWPGGTPYQWARLRARAALDAQPADDPPESLNDPRLCKVCLRPWSRAIEFRLLNTRTGKWHSGGGWQHGEETDCGHNAVADHWLWPL